MIKKITVFFLIIIGLNYTAQAQQSEIYTNHLGDYQKALALYNNDQYLAAQALFKNIRKTAKTDKILSDCDYYVANCAVRLNKQNADALVEAFVENHPTSTKRNTAFMDVADYYFANGKYAYAKKWYDKVDEDALARNERDQFYFNSGYVSFTTGDYKSAKNYLSRIENSQKYGSQAKYYIGFMAYEDDDYEQANQYFDQVSDQEKYKEKLSYYQADLNFKLGKFEEAIKLAKERLPESDRDEVSQLNKIIGESYFNLEQYAEAIPYLKEYKGKNGKWNNTDYYQLGYAYYMQKDYLSAISEFNKIVDGKNSIAQNAYYHLGESYVELDKKQEALNAFRNASEMDFDLKIQEDAWLNYAKISYDIGNPYQAVPQVLTEYLNTYPDTANKDEIESLLIDSYITSKNYEEALNLLEGKRSFESKAALQKVAFYRGLELYSDSNYEGALALFEKSLKEPRDPIFTARTLFWKAEANYNLTNYEQALIGFKEFQGTPNISDLSESKNIDYNLAYTYFKQKNYSQAEEYFENYIAQSNDDAIRLNDAYLRLGDVNFVSSDYIQAIEAYNEAVSINKVDSDYAYFQMSLSEGYAGNTNKKIKDLEQFINRYPKSTLRDDALYELANTLVKQNQTDKAMRLYNQLASEYPMSTLVPKAQLRQGLVYYNSGSNNEALSKFKSVANTYPGTPEATQAVATARLIYIDLGKVDEYAAWVKTLDYIDVTDAELDNTTYESAEKKFLENKTSEAIKQFNGYLNEFPNGIYVLQSHFYLAQLYYKDNLQANAKSHFEYVVNAPQSEFTQEALLRLSQIYLNEKDWLAAVQVLKRLEAEASFPQNVVFAQSNLMKAYYQLNKYNEAVLYAEKVLNQPKIDNKIISDAQVIIARSAIKTNDESRAQIAYVEVEKTATGETAAEALYYKAYFQNKDGDYEQSNTVVQSLAKDYSSYKYYSAKGLIIMAKNYYSLDDAFQASYILESVIENFNDFPEVTSEAQQELSKIKTEQAKTNSSIQTEED
jgi:TolA-binding protein